MCQLGNLFNKEAIISALINKTLNEQFSHIRGLRDLKQIIFSKNPSFTESRQALTAEDAPARYICPITRQDFNGCHPFVLIWTTGWLLSEKAVREMGIDALQAEYGPFSQDDVVTALPLEEQMAASNHRMMIRYARAASDKKHSKEEKKRKRAMKSVAEAKEDEQQRKSNDDDNVNVTVLSSDSNPGVKLKSTGESVKAAFESVKAQGNSSAVFNNLFHKTEGRETKKSADDLFMRVSGIRGTLR